MIKISIIHKKIAMNVHMWYKWWCQCLRTVILAISRFVHLRFQHAISKYEILYFLLYYRNLYILIELIRAYRPTGVTDRSMAPICHDIWERESCDISISPFLYTLADDVRPFTDRLLTCRITTHQICPNGDRRETHFEFISRFCRKPLFFPMAAGNRALSEFHMCALRNLIFFHVWRKKKRWKLFLIENPDVEQTYDWVV